MGGAVSAGEDNDDLTDNLVKASYIRTDRLAEIFKSVDRGFYYAKGQRVAAYTDRAWKFNRLHLSAPCIYSEVMEHLDLKPGMSFLNLGSGTGYVNTMAGLILGCYGVNHGIEIYPDVVEYAEERLAEFIQKSPAFDRFEFCPPQFEVGNCLLLPPETPGYDRVYCGAGCPPQFASYLMNLLNIGGKLVLPLQDQLQIKTRTGELEWDSSTALGVSFAELIVPESFEMTTKTPPRIVSRLQDLCRFCVRQVIRDKFVAGLPPKKIRKKRERRRSLDASSSWIYDIGDNMVMTSNCQLRRRRIISTSENVQSSHRRRVNTLGESDDQNFNESSDSSSEDSEIDDDDIAELRGETSQPGNNGETSTRDLAQNGDIVKGGKVAEGVADSEGTASGSSSSSSSVASFSQGSNADDCEHFEAVSAGDSNDIMPEKQNGHKGEYTGEESHQPSNAKASNSSKSEATSLKAGCSRRRRFKFFRSRPCNKHRNGADGPFRSARPTNQDQGNSEDRTGAADRERDLAVFDQIRRHHTERSLLRVLQARMADLDPPASVSEANNVNQSGEERDGDDHASSEEVYKEPLKETPFTIAIRRLPLPKKLVQFLLYNRQ